MDSGWEFWIDVGGTFTDCLARDADGRLQTCKVLSSGIEKGRCEQVEADGRLIDFSRKNDPPGLWTGYTLRLIDAQGRPWFESRVKSFDAAAGAFELEASPVSSPAGSQYELDGGEEAPLLAIRRILRLPLSQPFPRLTVKLGTTRGTNALLTRAGARTLLLCTRGTADVLLIGNQDRPRLFDLAITKPIPIFEQVVEVDERLDARGNVVQPLDEGNLCEQLAAARLNGIESVAICLLHSFANPTHEERLEELVRAAGFAEVSRSSEVAPLIKLVSRGDTTVVNAYLNPILRQYVGCLRKALADSRLMIMTSAGGLVDADRFIGKDSILSGPAGGVVGFARVARQAGFARAIGFDMGGTSTDVARYAGRYDMEYETKKAGVRIVSPMLAIETVAAGGGSVCKFDGVQLSVGPDSAGANPGPACYGRGGPLTVTDVNLHLGRIIPEQFPFPLDAAAVTRQLDDLCDQIASSPLGKRYSTHELAEGFRQIANVRMARAIRDISMARGFDPADDVLVSFGGAGAQHACSIARSLGMRDILIHPYSGILSAYGIGMADVRRYGERSVLAVYTQELQARLETLFAELEQSVREQVLAEGVAPDRIQPAVRSLEMRYRGADATLLVTLTDQDDAVSEFVRAHEQTYGYVHAGREVEVTTARVEIVGVMPEPEEAVRAVTPRRPEPSSHVTTWFSNQPEQTGLYLRADLQPGDSISGPAIICEPTSTIVIDPGFAAEILSRGEVHLRETDTSSRDPASTTVDPIRLEVFNNHFASIAEQMGTALQKTSFSTNVKERLDFSCAVFAPDGNLVVNAPHIPVHLGAMSETVKRIIVDNPVLQPGDVYVTNDPYRGGSHLPDVTVVTPVHSDETDELLFFTASRAHHSEIGGIVPGSMPPFSKNLAEEGVLIRNFKLIDAGQSHDSDLRELLVSGPFPSRSVEDNLADISAQVAANQSGVRLLRELVRQQTLPVVQAYMGHIQRAAAEKMRQSLRKHGSGRYERFDHLDCGAVIRVVITIEDDRAVIDFTGTADTLDSNLNANRAIVTAAVMYAFRCLIVDDIPLNSGVLDPLEIRLPTCLLNPREHDDPAQCAAMVGGNVETSQRVVDVLLGALGVAAASQGTMNNLTFGNEQFGYYETICGGSGATADADGASAVHTHMTNTRLTDIEVIERRYPVRVHEFSIRRGSGGAGAHQGGDGIIRRIEFLEPLRVSLLSERRGPYAPFGLAGGEDGKLGVNWLLRKGVLKPESLGGKASFAADPGDVLIIQTPGGGGYGPTK